MPHFLRRILHCAVQGTLTLTDLGESGAIVMLSEQDQMLTINPSAAFVLQRVLGTEGPIDEDFSIALTDQLARRFAISTEQAQQDLERFFEELDKWL